MERGEEDAELHAAMGHARVLQRDLSASIVPRRARIAKPARPVAGWRQGLGQEERPMRLAGKVAIISGAASGMGAATARRFGKEGAKVVVADVLEEEGRKVAADIVAANGVASFMKLDVTDEADWKRVVDATVAQYGRLDIMVNNAGISGSGVSDMLDTEAWDRLLAVNGRGVFLGTKYAVLAMKKSGGGSIVNLSSISGNAGQTMTHMGYNASKGAVRTLTKSTAVQFGADGIRANSVHPGLMPPMRTSGATADPAVRAKMLQSVPLRRAGEVDEVANAILFLASDEASYITGAELYVDGGYLAA
jgi:NAD(P)-dependent dehydrogenase (short-subunit alcohol dehydrogenase family)